MFSPKYFTTCVHVELLNVIEVSGIVYIFETRNTYSTYNLIGDPILKPFARARASRVMRAVVCRTSRCN